MTEKGVRKFSTVGRLATGGEIGGEGTGQGQLESTVRKLEIKRGIDPHGRTISLFRYHMLGGPAAIGRRGRRVQPFEVPGWGEMRYRGRLVLSVGIQHLTVA